MFTCPQSLLNSSYKKCLRWSYGKDEGESPPISLDGKELKSFRLVLSRCFNKNQLIILKKVAENTHKSITSILHNLEKEKEIPLSTLKLNSRILKQIGLIDYGNSKKACLTKLGRIVWEILGGEWNDRSK